MFERGVCRYAPVVFGGVLTLSLCLEARPQTPTKNPWAGQYSTRTAEAMAAQFENESRPVYRHRMAIVELLELKPGMVAAEIGAGSGSWRASWQRKSDNPAV